MSIYPLEPGIENVQSGTGVEQFHIQPASDTVSTFQKSGLQSNHPQYRLGNDTIKVKLLQH